MSLVQPLVQTPVPALDGLPLGPGTISGPVFGDAVFEVVVKQEGKGAGFLRLTATGRGAAVLQGKGTGLASVTATGRGGPAAPYSGKGTGLVRVTAAGRGGYAVLVGKGTALGRVTATGRGAAVLQGRAAPLLKLTATGRGAPLLQGKGTGLVRLTATGLGGVVLHGKGTSLARVTALGVGGVQIIHGRGAATMRVTTRGTGGYIVGTGLGIADVGLLADHQGNRARHWKTPGTARLRNNLDRIADLLIPDREAVLDLPLDAIVTVDVPEGATSSITTLPRTATIFPPLLAEVAVRLDESMAVLTNSA